MRLSGCSHLRIRDSNEYGLDVEKFIKHLENRFQLDIRRLPQWKEIVQRLHVATTDCKRKIQDANIRKKGIIDNLYMQLTRPSPFELTENLVRTAKTWEKLEARRKQPKAAYGTETQESSFLEKDVEVLGEVSDTRLTAHPNTEIIPSNENISILPLKSETEPEMTVTEIIPHLPVSICVNQHKLVSPLTSKDSRLSFKRKDEDFEITSESDFKEWLLLKKTSVIRCVPEIISINNRSLQEQIVCFSVVNCTTEYMHIRFTCVTDKSPFKRAKITPVTPQKLYPGLSVSFKLIFKLLQNDEDFTSSLYFKVGQNVLAGSPSEAFLIPIASKFKSLRSVKISEVVYIKPAYSWHVNEVCGHPTGFINISNNDNNHYRLHIAKRVVDLLLDSESQLSIKATGLNTQSVLMRTENEDENQSDLLSPSKEMGFASDAEVESLTTIGFTTLIVDEIVELALEAFVFEYTCVDILPHSKYQIPVHFTKVERIGSHHCHYDLELCDPVTENIIITQTVQIFAEVLPHPVEVYPDLLDMSNSPILHGFCEDYFIITNKHKWVHLTVKIKLTTKMKKLFSVTPIEAKILPDEKVNFVVRLCSRDFNSRNRSEDFLAHFTIKIIFSGDESIFYNVPVFYYEIIAPCAFEFKKVYNEKFYKDESERNLHEPSAFLVSNQAVNK